MFYSDRSGSYETWSIRPDGSALLQVTAKSKPVNQNGAWSPDGSHFLIGRFGSVILADLTATLPLKTPPVAPGLQNTPGVFCNDWKQSGADSLAACNLLMGPTNPEVVIYSPSTGKLEHTGVHGLDSLWAPAANPADRFRAVIYHRGSDCLLYDRVLRRETRLFRAAPYEVYNLGAPPDGKYIYYTERLRRSDLWLRRVQR